MKGFDRDAQGLTGAERLWREILGHDYLDRQLEAHNHIIAARASRREALLLKEQDKIAKARDLLIQFQCKLITSQDLDMGIKALCGKTERQWLV